MRVFIISLMLFCTLNAMGQDCNGELFLNADGSQNVYFIDTLHIENLVIVRSKKNGHYFSIKENAKLKGNIWNDPETYLYEENDYFFRSPRFRTVIEKEEMVIDSPSFRGVFLTASIIFISCAVNIFMFWSCILSTIESQFFRS